MRKLTVITSDHGPLWQHFPIVVNRYTDHGFLFLDHRTPLLERWEIYEKLLAEGVTEVEGVGVDAAAVIDCDRDIHDWRAGVTNDQNSMIAVVCHGCGASAVFPYPVPVPKVIGAA